MTTYFKKHRLFLFILFGVIGTSFIPTHVIAQDFTLAEAVTYIDIRLKSDYFLKTENNNLILYRKDNYGVNKINQRVRISDLEKVEINTNREISVRAYCKNMNKCSSVYLPDGYSSPFDYFALYVQDYERAELVTNALRYIIVNFQSTSNRNDPFVSYGSKNESKQANQKKNSGSFDFNKIKLGMNKEKVFEIFGEYAKLDSKERGYEVYRVMKDYELYFFYFTNNLLTRIDRGERSPDAIILIKN